MPDYFITIPDGWWTSNAPANNAKVVIGNGAEIHRDDDALPKTGVVAAGTYRIARLGDLADFIATAPVTGAFSDNFNRSDGAMGSDWVVYQNPDGTPSSGWRINSNEARFSTETTSGSTLLRTTTLISGGAFAQAEFVASLGGNNSLYGVTLVDAANGRVYNFVQNRASGSRDLIRRVSSTSTTIATGSIGNFPANAVIRIERIILDASTVQIRCLVNGSEIISFDDTSANRITGDVYGGLWGRGTAATHGSRWENFSQGTV